MATITNSGAGVNSFSELKRFAKADLENISAAYVAMTNYESQMDLLRAPGHWFFFSNRRFSKARRGAERERLKIIELLDVYARAKLQGTTIQPYTPFIDDVKSRYSHESFLYALNLARSEGKRKSLFLPVKAQEKAIISFAVAQDFHTICDTVLHKAEGRIVKNLQDFEGSLQRFTSIFNQSLYEEENDISRMYLSDAVTFAKKYKLIEDDVLESIDAQIFTTLPRLALMLALADGHHSTETLAIAFKTQGSKLLKASTAYSKVHSHELVQLAKELTLEGALDSDCAKAISQAASQGLSAPFGKDQFTHDIQLALAS